MKERRKTKRFAEKNKAVINFSIVKQSINRDANSAWTRDLSIDGAKLLTRKPFPSDSRLIISLELPGSQQIVKLWARVIWIKKSKSKKYHEVGVEFIHSIDTIPNLFLHLYGHGKNKEDKRSSKTKRIFLVDVSEA